MVRADFDYSNQAGESVFPIEEGYVFRLDEQQQLYNRSLKATIAHTVYIWILRVGKLEEEKQPQFRQVRTVILSVPESRPDKYMQLVSWKQRKSICRRLREGYTVVSDCCKYNYNKRSTAKFYKKVGLL